jgi:hypothetical protein
MKAVEASWTFFNSTFLKPSRSPYLENTGINSVVKKMIVYGCLKFINSYLTS